MRTVAARAASLIAALGLSLPIAAAAAGNGDSGGDRGATRHGCPNGPVHEVADRSG